MKKLLAGIFAIVLLISIIPSAFAVQGSASQSAVDASGKTVGGALPVVGIGGKATASGSTVEEIVIGIPEDDWDMPVRALPIEEPAHAPPEEVEDDAQETVTVGAEKKTVEAIGKVRSYTVVVDAPVREPVQGVTTATAAGEIVEVEEEEAVSGGAGQGVVIGLPAESKAIAAPEAKAMPAQQGVAVKIEAEEAYTTIESEEVKATTTHTISVKENKIYVATAADDKKEITIMPSRIREILETRDEQVIGETVVEEVTASFPMPKITVKKIELAVEEEKPVYNVESEEDGKLLAFIPVKMQVSSKVDAVSGVIEQTKRPWWSFLVFGQMKKMG